MSIFGFAASIKLTLTATIFFSLRIITICSSSSSSKETPNFILLQCILKPSQKLTVQWKSPHRELTTPDENLFVSVETFAEKASESFCKWKKANILKYFFHTNFYPLRSSPLHSQEHWQVGRVRVQQQLRVLGIRRRRGGSPVERHRGGAAVL